MDQPQTRIAWLHPTFFQGEYWHPVFKNFTKRYGASVFFTGYWQGFVQGFENSFRVKKVGNAKYISKRENDTNSYHSGYTHLSLGIVQELMRYRPEVVLSSAFSIWTLLAVLFKGIGGWRVVIYYDGSSPTVDFLHSPLRLSLRRFIARRTDAFASNSLAGTRYLRDLLQVPEDKIATGMYLVANPEALTGPGHAPLEEGPAGDAAKFLFVGQLVPRKGVRALLEAAAILRKRGQANFTITLAGRGPQGDELKAYAESLGLHDLLRWAGKVPYTEMGRLYASSHALILPTYEDVWGMVVPEAMLFGTPVLCSNRAGVCEMIEQGVNGFVFDPEKPEELADQMEAIIRDPSLAEAMGKASRETVMSQTAEHAAGVFFRAVDIARRAQ